MGVFDYAKEFKTYICIILSGLIDRNVEAVCQCFNIDFNASKSKLITHN